MTGQGPAAAVGALSAALAADPGRADLWRQYAAALVAAGRAAEAWDAAVRAVELAPAEAGSHRAVGAVAAALDDRRQAESAYRHALRLDPTDTLARSALDRLAPPARRRAPDPDGGGRHGVGAGPGRRRAPEVADELPVPRSGRRRAPEPSAEEPTPRRHRRAPEDAAAPTGPAFPAAPATGRRRAPEDDVLAGHGLPAGAVTGRRRAAEDAPTGYGLPVGGRRRAPEDDPLGLGAPSPRQEAGAPPSGRRRAPEESSGRHGAPSPSAGPEMWTGGAPPLPAGTGSPPVAEAWTGGAPPMAAGPGAWSAAGPEPWVGGAPPSAGQGGGPAAVGPAAWAGGAPSPAGQGGGPAAWGPGPAAAVSGARADGPVTAVFGMGAPGGAVTGPPVGATRVAGGDGWRTGLVTAVRVVWLVGVLVYLGLVDDGIAPYTAGAVTGIAVLAGAYARLRWAAARTRRPPAADRTPTALTAAAAGLILLVVPAEMLGHTGPARLAAVAAVTTATVAALLVGPPGRRPRPPAGR